MSKIKEMFPNHKLGSKHEYELKQFTANDMIEFAEIVAKETLRNASDREGIELTLKYVCTKSILNENNIPKL